MKPILVIGSINMDLVVQTPRAPAAGETISAGSFNTFPGGKGANQAVAAARLGSRVQMVGRVGQDGFGAQLLQVLAAEGIDTNQVRPLPGVSTGVGVIIVEPGGENRILIVSGANLGIPPAEVDALDGLIAAAGLLILQFEIPLETVWRAVLAANQHGVPVLLNPAPAYPVPVKQLALVDTLVVNEVECSMLTGLPVSDTDSAARAGRELLRGRTRLVVVTLGSKGAVAVTPSEALSVPAFPVKAVDTTAAGDTFIGALAAALTSGRSLPDCLVYASAAGALAVTRMGAQSSIPTAAEVEGFLSDHRVMISSL